MHQQDTILNSITHSSYYGCTVRVISKAFVSYEGILDGISIDKDRIFLKNVRVNGNQTDSLNQGVNSIEENDRLNTVMIDHLTNDMHIYDEVCLNVRDIRELKLVRLPATFQESKKKLQTIDPCLVDIRLSNESLSSISTIHRSEPIRINSSQPTTKPVTLLAKKVLPKKIERNQQRKTSPIRITITSKLNPNATPFYTRQQQTNPTVQNRSYQRFIPPRQMVLKKNFQQPTKSVNQEVQRSNVVNEILSTPPIRQRLSVPTNKRSYLAPTNSLPYQNRHSGDFNHFQILLPIVSHRVSRTVSGNSSTSSLSSDLGFHSTNQLDLISDDGQYDFEKANDEFRRYLELEELVIGGRTSSSASINSHSDDNNVNSQSSNSYKKEISFFDRISCTATTGTAVGYTEVDEDVKNLETFGDDALLINKDGKDFEWAI